MKKKNLFLYANIIIPLFIGLVIYLFCYRNTYINSIFENYLGLSLPYLYFDNIIYHFVTCWACDILWAYSLTFSLYFCFKPFTKPLRVTSVLSILFAVSIEVLQAVQIINGTFDIWDIILEISAISLAVIIIKRSFLK
ncbi:MAG: hypothetical protein IJA80_00335 [Clostridia bacterium]|nr:hypothetical protein [Clostridia bacterium]